MAKFLPGQSGNLKGRPPKSRALSDLLAIQGELPITEGQPTYQAQLARNLWQLLTEGRVELANGPIVFTNAKDWLEAAKFVIQHIDGPAPSTVTDSKIEIIVTRAASPAFDLPETLLHDDEA